VPAPGADPENVPAIARAGFAAVSLAGNHISDLGAEGISDTLSALDEASIAHAGAAATLEAARAPALFNRAGKRIALLSYNCVGPESAWAGMGRAGCAYVRIENADGGPIAPSARLEQIDADSLAAMAQDVARARKEADIVVVALHKGIVHTPARLAPYERRVAQAAIEAGCDVVCGHHAHIVRGIEIYRGKPIFHGLGNGCVVTRALSPNQSHAARAEWARKRRQLFGFEPDPAYSLAPFHPEAVNAMLGRARFHDDGRIECGFVPVHVEPPGRPTLAHGETARRIVNYIAEITPRAGLAPLSIDFREDGAWLR
jgi:poly-gamma-glutamate synthesis protein (capsule biosynthesis protein)